jgi:drug/metabolite transporter (DMT)-like permease
MRRLSSVELMLLATVLLWALNVSVTKYILEHGFLPLAYASVRYALAGLIFVGLTLAAERALRIELRQLPLVVVAALALWLNQVSFVLALDVATATTIGLLLGAIPIFTALLGLALGTESLTQRFWLGAAVSAVGVAFVALGSGGDVSGGYQGVLLGLSTCATWAVYSVAAAPLMQTYSPMRVSAVVIPLAWVPLVLVALPQLGDQEWDLGWQVWLALAFATVGPLVLTNILWFRSLHRVGPARATLAVNLQPFVAALLAVVLLSEPLSALQIAGGALILLGILVVRRRTAPAVEAA